LLESATVTASITLEIERIAACNSPAVDCALMSMDFSPVGIDNLNVPGGRILSLDCSFDKEAVAFFPPKVDPSTNRFVTVTPTGKLKTQVKILSELLSSCKIKVLSVKVEIFVSSLI
jgi:hypothetical protein